MVRSSPRGDCGGSPQLPTPLHHQFMTKRHIAKQTAERLGVRTTRASQVMQQVFDGVVGTLVNEGRIELRNFGVFEVRKRKSRPARNPRTGEIAPFVEVPRPSRALMPVADRTALRSLSPERKQGPVQKSSRFRAARNAAATDRDSPCLKPRRRAGWSGLR